MNLPNKITLLRFLLGIVYFIVLSFVDREGPESNSVLIDIALVIFLIAVVSDILDGYFARKYNIITSFGRIADPLVDKILICGSFIFFITFNELVDIYYPWMIVIILARELLIQGIRAIAETMGANFSANFWGKHKMLLQSIIVLGTLLYLGHLGSFLWTKLILIILVWIMLFLTVVSGIFYIISFKKILKGQKL